MIAEGYLDWSIDHGLNNDATLQVDGNDMVAISDVMEDGSAHVVVWKTSHPDSTVAWEGFVNVRERKDEDVDEISAENAAAVADRISAYLGSQREWDIEALEIIADMLKEHGYRHPGHEDNVEYYRGRADALELECYDEDDEQ